jgi:hypothetical protein
MDRNKADDDHFIELDAKKLKHIETERKKNLTEALQRVDDIHFMKCPRCSKQLEEDNIKDAAIVICEQCRGIWVDFDSFTKILRLSDDVLGIFLDRINKN